MRSMKTDETTIIDRLLKKVESRRKTLSWNGWIGIAASIFGNFVASFRFFYPRVQFDPPSHTSRADLKRQVRDK